MKICYVDEAGCLGVFPESTSEIQPVFIMLGLIIDYSKIVRITETFLHLKQRFFPNKQSDHATYLGGILNEVKGSELRKKAVKGSRNSRRHANGYLDGLVKICEDADVKIVCRVWVKGIGKPFDGRSVYTSSVQAICSYFQKYLSEINDLGILVADSRLPHLNTQVAHSIFTQKFKSSGDLLDRMVELPVFSHSNNHAGLQIADTLCSGIVWPLVLHTYCDGYINNVHMLPEYVFFKTSY